MTPISRLGSGCRRILMAPVDQVGGSGGPAAPRIIRPNLALVNAFRGTRKLPPIAPGARSAEIRGIVVIDDEDQIAAVIKRSISRRFTAGMQAPITVITNQDQIRSAADLLVAAPVDLVFIDFNMPGITGAEIITDARARGFRGIIIGITGKMGENFQAFINAGADVVLGKPFPHIFLVGAFIDIEGTSLPLQLSVLYAVFFNGGTGEQAIKALLQAVKDKKTVPLYEKDTVNALFRAELAAFAQGKYTLENMDIVSLLDIVRNFAGTIPLGQVIINSPNSKPEQIAKAQERMERAKNRLQVIEDWIKHHPERLEAWIAANPKALETIIYP